MQQNQDTKPPELSPQDARQARPGKPVLYMLVAGICGTVIGFVIALLYVG